MVVEDPPYYSPTYKPLFVLRDGQDEERKAGFDRWFVCVNVYSDPSLEIRLSLRISFVFVHCLHEECPMKEGEVLLLRVASGADRQTHVRHTRASLAHLPCPSTCRQALRSRIPCSLRETTRM